MKRKELITRSGLFILFFLSLGNLMAQTTVNGDISGVWNTAGNPYYVTGDVTIPSSDSLIIEPGVNIQFIGTYDFNVNGLLKAIGTTQHPISFYGNGSPGSWKSINFNANSHSACMLKYCIIRDGGGVDSVATVYIKNTENKVIVDNCEISNSSGHGLLIQAYLNVGHYDDRNTIKCSPLITSNKIFNNIYSGIYVYAYYSGGHSDHNTVIAEPIINDNIIYANGINGIRNRMYARYTYQLSASEIRVYAIPDLIKNTIWGNGKNGIECTKTVSGYFLGVNVFESDPFISSNIVGASAEYGLDANGYVSVDNAKHNDFWGNSLGNLSGIGGGLGVNNRVNMNLDSCDVNLNIFFDPEFQDAENHDFRLTESSKCIDAGDLELPMDPDQTFPDIGAYFFDKRYAMMELTPDTLDFGDVVINGKRLKNIDIHNSGTGNLEIFSLNISGQDSGRFKADSTGFTVLPNGTEQLEISFEPDSEIQAEAIILFSSNGGDGQVVLTGKGIATSSPPELIKNLPDTSFMENSGTHLMTYKLSEYFYDPDAGDILSYQVITSPPFVNTNISTDTLILNVQTGSSGAGDIIVSAQDLAEQSLTDTFSVQVFDSLKITFPNGGEELGITESVNITWDTNQCDSVRIELMKSTNVYSILSMANENSGSFSWIVSDLIEQADDYRIRISCLNYPEISDIGDATFSIVDRLAPIAPDSLTAGGFSPSPWQNTPVFEVNWINPPDVSGINRAYYKIGFSPGGQTDTSGTVSGTPPVFISAIQEGDHSLYLWLEDGKGNKDYNNNSSVKLRYDQTPPTGTEAESPDTSSLEKFMVSWSGTADQGGSGISGVYNINYKTDNNIWSFWKENYTGTNAEFIGIHGHTYHFEAAAHDIAGNIEKFNGIPEASTHIDTTLDIDMTPPLKPLGLQATPESWSNVNLFSVSWYNPPGDDTISGAWYKIGAEPDSPDDGIFIDGDIKTISDIQLPSEGQFDIHVWLKDLADNYLHTNAAKANLYYDQTRPLLTHDPVTLTPLNNTIALTANASDNMSGIQELKLIYRKTGDVQNESEIDFVDNKANIPGEASTQSGLQYRVVARDMAGNMTSSGYHSIQVMLADGEGRQAYAQHYGTSSRDYRIFSVPFDLEDKRPRSVFEDDLGEQDNEIWKLFDALGENLQNYSVIRDMPITEPGKGFLLIVNRDSILIDVGIARSPKVSDYNKLALTQGWNLIGNPFDFDVPIDSLKINGSIPQEIWYLGSSGWSQNPPYLKRWEGVAINADADGFLNIGAGTGSATKIAMIDKFAGSSWGMQLIAKGTRSVDLDNYVGVNGNNAAFEKKMNWSEPPRFYNAISLYLISSQSESRYSTLIQQENQDGYIWEIVLEAGYKENPIIIDFKRIGEIPELMEMSLLDMDLNLMWDLDQLNWIYELKMGTNEKRNLTLVIGTEDFVKNSSQKILAIPNQFELKQNYPNPFNPSTNIVFGLPAESPVHLDVFDVLGKKIKTLIAGKSYSAGYHRVVWDGTNDNHILAGSGMYIFRIRNGSEYKIIKAILLR